MIAQETTIRALISALSQESDPLSISPQRMAGILEALLEVDTSVEADVADLRRKILQILMTPGTSGGSVTVEFLSPAEAKDIVKNIFND